MEQIAVETNSLQEIAEKPMSTQQVTQDIILLRFPLVNACLVGNPGINNNEWALVGAGMAHTGKDILQTAEGRFGKGSQPKAIILTHGHFDHVGAIMELINAWNTQVYAHELEMPYLTGQQDYPPADPSVDDGLIAKISPTFPHKGMNLGNRVQPLPGDGGVPGMFGWRWVHTPGHSPGHISLFRETGALRSLVNMQFKNKKAHIILRFLVLWSFYHQIGNCQYNFRKDSN